MEITIPETAKNHDEWEQGWISSEDTHCFVLCDCGERLSVSDYKIFECPNCHKGYITKFMCFRISVDAMRSIPRKQIEVHDGTATQEE